MGIILLKIKLNKNQMVKGKKKLRAAFIFESRIFH